MTKSVFISYSHADSRLLDRLHKHLAQLQREGSVSAWFDRAIDAGANIDDAISDALAAADIFIAALSPDFIASNYCYETELRSALERESNGDLIVVPVIFEPCDWLSTPLGKFKAVPDDGKPISEFTNENAGFLNVVTELRKLAQREAPPSRAEQTVAAPMPASGIALAGRYRIKRDFDELHKRDFVEKSLREIYEFFRTSVTEISSVDEIEARLSDFSNDYFSCTIINRGMKRAFETLHVRNGGRLSEISILYGEENRLNSSNGGFAVVEGEYELAFGASFFGYGSDREMMSARQVAQKMWDDLLARVGVDYE